MVRCVGAAVLALADLEKRNMVSMEKRGRAWNTDLYALPKFREAIAHGGIDGVGEESQEDQGRQCCAPQSSKTLAPPIWRQHRDRGRIKW